MSRFGALFHWAAVIVLVGATLAAAADSSLSALPFTVPMGPDGVQRATITLDSYSYSPEHVIVEAGEPVELTLTSVTILTPHNFIIDDPASGLSVEQDVKAGKTVVVRFTPPRPGVFAMYCDKKLPFFPSHREKGMEGKFEVR
ncbi:MAG TPA: cupredoxin domain-containing protein [Nitrospira sp.]|nr:cupredoxin domain-containing protein [Nitrospira sp.]